MFSGLISGDVLTHLVQGMDASAMRQRVHSNNLANLNTPHFKGSRVEFENLLKEAMSPGGKRVSVTNPMHLQRHGAAGETMRVVKDPTTSMRSDGNNVDVDAEMAELAINQLYYNALSQQLNDRLGVVRYVINEGRR